MLDGREQRQPRLRRDRLRSADGTCSGHHETGRAPCEAQAREEQRHAARAAGAPGIGAGDDCDDTGALESGNRLDADTRAAIDDRLQPTRDRKVENACNAVLVDQVGVLRERRRRHTRQPVALFGPELAIQAPGWLGPPDTRPSEVPKAMRWMPSTAFFQVLVDMKNSANVVPGQFVAKGHDYRSDLLPFFDAALGFDVTQAQLDAIAAWLELEELQRSEWIAAHGATGKSLAATVIERALTDLHEKGSNETTTSPGSCARSPRSSAPAGARTSRSRSSAPG